MTISIAGIGVGASWGTVHQGQAGQQPVAPPDGRVQVAGGHHGAQRVDGDGWCLALAAVARFGAPAFVGA